MPSPQSFDGKTLAQLRQAGSMVNPAMRQTQDDSGQNIYDVMPDWMSFGGSPLGGLAEEYNSQLNSVNGGSTAGAAANFSNHLVQNGMRPMEAPGPNNSTWRWIEDAQGNVVVEPQKINNNDPAFAAAAAAAAAAVTAGAAGAGFGVGGAPGAVPGAAGAVPGAAPGAAGVVPSAPAGSAPFSLGGSGMPGYSVPADAFGMGGSIVPTAGDFGVLTGPAAESAAAGLAGVSSPLTAAPGGGLFGMTGGAGIPDLPTNTPPAGSQTPPPAASTGSGDPLSTGSAIGDKLLGTGAGLLAGAGVQALAPNPPTPPNPIDTIKAQTDANIEAADINTANGRPNVTNPFGSSTWTRVADPTMPGGFRWTNDIKFSDEQQGLYDTTVDNQQSLLNTSSGLLDRIDENYATPFDLGSYGAAGTVNSDPNNFLAQRDQVQQSLYDRLTRTRTPQMERDRAQMDSTLRNQGLTPGSEAYDNGMRGLLEAQSGELQDYNSRSIEMGGSEQSRLNTDQRANVGFNNTVRSNSINEGLTQRNMPLSEYNALTNGTQPTLPTFQAYGTGSVQPANVQGVQQQGYNNAQDIYNARMSQYQNILNFGTKIGG